MDVNDHEDSKDRESQDLVVVERRALLSMLDAVINTLRSSINLELLQKKDAVTPEHHQELHQTLVNARGSLITGVKKMRETIVTLPNVTLQADAEPGVDDKEP